MVFQDRWPVMAVAFQDRFHCTCTYVRNNICARSVVGINNVMHVVNGHVLEIKIINVINKWRAVG